MTSEATQHSVLTRRIVLALVAALVLALVLPWGLKAAGHLDWMETLLVPVDLGGQIFMRLLKMVVVPLVVTSVMSGVLGLGDVRRLGRPGVATLLYFLATTFMAVVLGQILVVLIRPGEIVEKSPELQAQIDAGNEKLKGTLESPTAPKTATDIFKSLVLMLFSDNMLRSAVSGDLLPLIIFSIVFAGILTTMGDRAATLRRLVIELNDALMTVILLIMKVAPLGIFCLVLAQFGKAMAEGTFCSTLQSVGAYFMTVVLGLSLHALVVLPLILWLWTKRNPYVYMRQVADALLMAFSTSSSSATLPVTIERTIHGAGVARRSVDFVVPLGSTINMDGTALYEAVAAIFIAQMLGMHLPWHAQIVIAITATLAAIGAAGIPQAGLVTMPIVLASAGIPTSGMGLILSIDWFLDRFRTVVNVFGDTVGAAIIERYFDGTPEAPEPAEALTAGRIAP